MIQKYDTIYKKSNVSFREKPFEMFCKWFSATVFAHGLDGRRVSASMFLHQNPDKNLRKLKKNGKSRKVRSTYITTPSP